MELDKDFETWHLWGEGVQTPSDSFTKLEEDTVPNLPPRWMIREGFWRWRLDEIIMVPFKRKDKKLFLLVEYTFYKERSRFHNSSLLILARSHNLAGSWVIEKAAIEDNIKVESAMTVDLTSNDMS